jgi:Tfp pilus assembly protein PilN
MFRHQVTYGSVFTAIEISHNSQYNLLSLKKKKNALEIVQKEQYQDQDSLFLALKGIKHVFLVINNEQVLTKDVTSHHIAKESTVKVAFPNITLDDFYYGVLDHGTSSLVSICRKEAVESILDEFQNKGISIIQFSLGDTNFSKLLPFLNDFNFYTSRGLFEVNNGEVIHWKKSEETTKTYEVNGLLVESHHLLPLAGVISYCSGLETSQEDSIQRGLVQEFNQKRIFQLGTRLGLGFLLVLLLINFFVFSSYRNQKAALSDELSMNEVYKKQLVSLDDLVAKKKRLVEGMNSVSNSKVIWYIDQIAQSVPKTISLENLSYQPTTRSLKKDTPLTFKTDQVVVSGIAKDDTDFTNWSSSLEQTKWVDKLSNMELDGESSKYTAFSFTIHLTSDSR